MSFIDLNGFSMKYEKFPQTSRHNILFIHGNLASKEWWHPTIETLRTEASGDKTILTADWRGYGESKGIK